MLLVREKRIACARVVGAVCLMAAAGHAAAAVRYVDDSAPAGGNGQNWATAYNSVVTALAAAVPGDELRIGQGTYRPGAARTSTFTLRDGISLRGGYAGYGAVNPHARDPRLYPTVLSGDLLSNDGLGFTNMADNCYQVVTSPSAVSASTVIDGLVICGGNADGGFGSQDRGAGMTISGTVTVLGCTFRGNSASGAAAINVGATANPAIRNCVMAGNRATGSSSFGAGGAVHVAGNAEICGCLFAGNTAAGNGGGLSMATSAANSKVYNCVFSANSAAQGGGIQAGPGPIVNCTIAENTALNGGGGINAPATVTPAVTNCILWNNSSSSGGQEVNGSTSVTYSCVKGGMVGLGNISTEPVFLDSMGPDVAYGTADDNYRLASGPALYSPCVDAGSVNPILAIAAVDLEGQPRFRDHPLVADSGAGAGEAVDIGAYEATPRTCTIDFNGDGFIDPDDLADFVTAFFLRTCP